MRPSLESLRIWCHWKLHPRWVSSCLHPRTLKRLVFCTSLAVCQEVLWKSSLRRCGESTTLLKALRDSEIFPFSKWGWTSWRLYPRWLVILEKTSILFLKRNTSPRSATFTKTYSLSATIRLKNQNILSKKLYSPSQILKVRYHRSTDFLLFQLKKMKTLRAK